MWKVVSEPLATVLINLVLGQNEDWETRLLDLHRELEHHKNDLISAAKALDDKKYHEVADIFYALVYGETGALSDAVRHLHFFAENQSEFYQKLEEVRL